MLALDLSMRRAERSGDAVVSGADLRTLLADPYVMHVAGSSGTPPPLFSAFASVKSINQGHPAPDAHAQHLQAYMLPAAEWIHRGAGRESSTANEITMNLECMQGVSPAAKVSPCAHPATQLRQYVSLRALLFRHYSASSRSVRWTSGPQLCP